MTYPYQYFLVQRGFSVLGVRLGESTDAGLPSFTLILKYASARQADDLVRPNEVQTCALKVVHLADRV